MGILDPYVPGEGSLPLGVVKQVADCERTGWAILRSLQGNPVVDVLRFTITPGDPARGIADTKDPVAGLEGLRVLWSDLSLGEKQAANLDLSKDTRRFEFFEDIPMFLTDLLVFEGKRWAVNNVYQDDHLGNTIVRADISEQST